MNTEVMFSSASVNWSTPQWFFDQYNQEYNFTLDVCALPENAKCLEYFTPDDNGLNQTWEGRLKGKYPTIWNLKTWTENFLTTLRGCGLQGNLCRKGAVKSKYDKNSSAIILERLHAGPEDDNS